MTAREATRRLTAPFGANPIAMHVAPYARMAVAFLVATAIFALIIAIDGEDAWAALRVMWDTALTTDFGRTEIMVKLIPFGLCAAAVAIPARGGLINVGAEGQFYMGAWAASGMVLYSGAPGWALLPLAFVAGAAGGGAWAAIVGFMRVKGRVNEAISSLLLNFVAIQIVNYFVYGPWRDPEGPAWPYTAKFPSGASLPYLYNERLTAGIIVVAVVFAAFFLVMRYTRAGYELKVVGGNAAAAERSGIPVQRYLIGAMIIGGAIAGLAGMAEVCGIQGRLRQGISVNYGYIGFLASWLGGHRPLGILAACLLFGAISVGGDSLQLGAGLPGSTVNILMSLLLFGVLASRKRTGQVGA